MPWLEREEGETCSSAATTPDKRIRPAPNTTAGNGMTTTTTTTATTNTTTTAAMRVRVLLLLLLRSTTTATLATSLTSTPFERPPAAATSRVDTYYNTKWTGRLRTVDQDYHQVAAVGTPVTHQQQLLLLLLLLLVVPHLLLAHG